MPPHVQSRREPGLSVEARAFRAAKQPY